MGVQALTSLTDNERLFQAEMEKFAETAIRPRVAAMDEAGRMDAQLIEEIFRTGLMGIEIPEAHGGGGGSFFLSCLAIEALSAVDAAVGVFVDVQNTLINNVFLRFGSPALQQRVFPRLTSSEVGSFCLTEPDSGSDAFALASRAVAQGKGWRLHGKKVFITNAAEASLFIVFANINPEAGYRGITAFLVEKTDPGFSLGKKEDKLGIRASSTCEVILDNVFVDESRLVGELGKGYKIAIETLNEGRIGVAAQMLGLAQGAFKAALRYAGERVQFGKKIREFQSIQFRFAELACKIESAKLLVYNAARLKDEGKSFVKEAAMAKYLAADIAEEVASSCLEVFGGYGYIKEFPAEKYYRDVKIGKLYEGTSNLQLQTIFKLLGS